MCRCDNGIAYPMPDGNHIYCEDCEEGRRLAAGEEERIEVPASGRPVHPFFGGGGIVMGSGTLSFSNMNSITVSG